MIIIKKTKIKQNDKYLKIKTKIKIIYRKAIFL